MSIWVMLPKQKEAKIARTRLRLQTVWEGVYCTVGITVIPLFRAVSGREAVIQS